MKEKLTVIVPVYNAEKYLRQCVDSILAQTYDNIELILVDNMSTDDSGLICREYEQRYNNILYVCENSNGAAPARNKGIMCATGKYITFVDSDDFIAPNAYEQMLTKLECEKADAAVCSFQYVDEAGKPLRWYVPKLKKYIRKNKVNSGARVAAFFLTSMDIEGFAWNKVFARSLLVENNLKFDETKKSYEDIVFTFQLLLACRKISLCPEKLYYYRQVASSLTHKNDASSKEDYDEATNEIQRIASTVGLRHQARSYVSYREVLKQYNERKSRKTHISLWVKCSRVINILLYQRSEKLKTIIKAII